MTKRTVFLFLGAFLFLAIAAGFLLIFKQGEEKQDFDKVKSDPVEKVRKQRTIEEVETDEQIPEISFKKTDGSLVASFQLEIAATPAEHQKGLMNRQSLPADQGMLFVYQQPQPLSFWMKNTLIPLDMIFISSDKKVVSISHDAQPCSETPCLSYKSKRPAQYVLEINGGLCQEKGIKEGIEVDFNLP